MATTIRQTIAYPAFLDGQPKRLLIGNQWVDSASGKTFDSLNPATDEVLATVAEGDSEDINRAVAAARRAFEGPWSNSSRRSARCSCSSWQIWSNNISMS